MLCSSRNVALVLSQHSQKQFFLGWLLEEQIGVVFGQIADEGGVVQFSLHHCGVAFKEVVSGNALLTSGSGSYGRSIHAHLGGVGAWVIFNKQSLTQGSSPCLPPSQGHQLSVLPKVKGLELLNLHPLPLKDFHALQNEVD